MMRWPETCRERKVGFQKRVGLVGVEIGRRKSRPKLFPEGVKRAIAMPSIMTWCMQGGKVMNRELLV